MLKVFITILIVLAIIGGAIQFRDSEGNFGIIISKEKALHGIQDGAIKSYDYFINSNVFDTAKKYLYLKKENETN